MPSGEVEPPLHTEHNRHTYLGWVITVINEGLFALDLRLNTWHAFRAMASQVSGLFLKNFHLIPGTCTIPSLLRRKNKSKNPASEPDFHKK